MGSGIFKFLKKKLNPSFEGQYNCGTGKNTSSRGGLLCTVTGFSRKWKRKQFENQLSNENYIFFRVV
jgi:hypothetical protein